MINPGHVYIVKRKRIAKNKNRKYVLFYIMWELKAKYNRKRNGATSPHLIVWVLATRLLHQKKEKEITTHEKARVVFRRVKALCVTRAVLNN